MAEHGPFESEWEARDTRAVREANAAWDADPVPGKHVPHHLKIMTDACRAAGVELGAYDLRTLTWLGNYEAPHCAAIAGMIYRAYEAGLAASGPEDDG